MEELITKRYNCMNVSYLIEAPRSMHEKLKIDAEYATDFFRNLQLRSKIGQRTGPGNNNEVISDINTSVHETVSNTQVDASLSKNLNITPSTSFKTLEVTNSKENTESSSKTGSDSFKWSTETIKLLLYHRKAFESKFRNPKIKPNSLWEKIVDEFKKKGYTITIKQLKNKWRSMRDYCRQINATRKTTGTGREDWEWYYAVQEILAADKSVCFDNEVISNIIENEEDEVMNLDSSSDNDDNEKEDEELSNKNFPDVKSTLQENCNGNKENCSKLGKLSKKQKRVQAAEKSEKAKKIKTLYYQRKKQIQNDQDKNKSLNSISKQCEINNIIQEKNCEMQCSALNALAESNNNIAAAIRERTEVLRELGNILKSRNGN